MSASPFLLSPIALRTLTVRFARPTYFSDKHSVRRMKNLP